MRILIIGGTGFIGSAIARRLSQDLHRLRLPTRRLERSKHLTVLPTVELVEADVHDPAMLARLVQGQDAIISLVGILRGDFNRAHAELPAKIAAAAKAAGVRRIVHISALGAAADAPSVYLRSKAAGEKALFESGLDVTVLRPSVVFGSGDSFLNLFAALQRRIPILPLGCAYAQFQPVWVEDVATAAVACLSRSESIGQIYQLGGPRIYTLRDLVGYAGKLSGHRAWIVELPDALAYLQAWFMEWMPGAPLTRDNYRSMHVPNICAKTPSLPFGMTATPLEAVAPAYLADSRWRPSDGDFESAAR